MSSASGSRGPVRRPRPAGPTGPPRRTTRPCAGRRSTLRPRPQAARARRPVPAGGTIWTILFHTHTVILLFCKILASNEQSSEGVFYKLIVVFSVSQFFKEKIFSN